MKWKTFVAPLTSFSHAHTQSHKHTGSPPIGITARSSSNSSGRGGGGRGGRFYIAFPWFLYILCSDFLAFVFHTHQHTRRHTAAERRQNSYTNTRTHSQRHTNRHAGGRAGEATEMGEILQLCTLTPQQSLILIFVFAFFNAPVIPLHSLLLLLLLLLLPSFFFFAHLRRSCCWRFSFRVSVTLPAFIASCFCAVFRPRMALCVFQLLLLLFLLFFHFCTQKW